MGAAGENSSRFPTEIRPGVIVCADAQAVAREAAAQLVHLARRYTERGRFSVALAGGNTPREMYRLLASEEFRAQVHWNQVQVFWSDERAVPPDHPESNYGMAYRELLSHIPIPPENVHRMEAERADLDRAARDYEEVLHRDVDRDARGFPRFHLILLGLGTEGHTASLFPPARALAETTRCVETSWVEKLGARRMTLTLPALNAAERVMFLVTGVEKAGILARVVQSSGGDLPAEQVRPTSGERIFLVDTAAASLLPKTSPG